MDTFTSHEHRLIYRETPRTPEQKAPESTPETKKPETLENKLRDQAASLRERLVALRKDEEAREIDEAIKRLDDLMQGQETDIGAVNAKINTVVEEAYKAIQRAEQALSAERFKKNPLQIREKTDTNGNFDRVYTFEAPANEPVSLAYVGRVITGQNRRCTYYYDWNLQQRLSTQEGMVSFIGCPQYFQSSDGTWARRGFIGSQRAEKLPNGNIRYTLGLTKNAVLSVKILHGGHSYEIKPGTNEQYRDEQRVGVTVDRGAVEQELQGREFQRVVDQTTKLAQDTLAQLPEVTAKNKRKVNYKTRPVDGLLKRIDELVADGQKNGANTAELEKVREELKNRHEELVRQKKYLRIQRTKPRDEPLSSEAKLPPPEYEEDRPTIEKRERLAAATRATDAAVARAKQAMEKAPYPNQDKIIKDAERAIIAEIGERVAQGLEEDGRDARSVRYIDLKRDLALIRAELYRQEDEAREKAAQAERLAAMSRATDEAAAKADRVIENPAFNQEQILANAKQAILFEIDERYAQRLEGMGDSRSMRFIKLQQHLERINGAIGRIEGEERGRNAKSERLAAMSRATDEAVAKANHAIEHAPVADQERILQGAVEALVAEMREREAHGDNRGHSKSVRFSELEQNVGRIGNALRKLQDANLTRQDQQQRLRSFAERTDTAVQNAERAIRNAPVPNLEETIRGAEFAILSEQYEHNAQGIIGPNLSNARYNHLEEVLSRLRAESRKLEVATKDQEAKRARLEQFKQVTDAALEAADHAIANAPVQGMGAKIAAAEQAILQEMGERLAQGEVGPNFTNARYQDLETALGRIREARNKVEDDERITRQNRERLDQMKKTTDAAVQKADEAIKIFPTDLDAILESASTALQQEIGEHYVQNLAGPGPDDVNLRFTNIRDAYSRVVLAIAASGRLQHAIEEARRGVGVDDFERAVQELSYTVKHSTVPPSKVAEFAGKLTQEYATAKPGSNVQVKYVGGDENPLIVIRGN